MANVNPFIIFRFIEVCDSCTRCHHDWDCTNLPILSLVHWHCSLSDPEPAHIGPPPHPVQAPAHFLGPALPFALAPVDPIQGATLAPVDHTPGRPGRARRTAATDNSGSLSCATSRATCCARPAPGALLRVRPQPRTDACRTDRPAHREPLLPVRGRAAVESRFPKPPWTAAIHFNHLCQVPRRSRDDRLRRPNHARRDLTLTLTCCQHSPCTCAGQAGPLVTAQPVLCRAAQARVRHCRVTCFVRCRHGSMRIPIRQYRWVVRRRQELDPAQPDFNPVLVPVLVPAHVHVVQHIQKIRGTRQAPLAPTGRARRTVPIGSSTSIWSCSQRTVRQTMAHWGKGLDAINEYEMEMKLFSALFLSLCLCTVSI